MGVLRYLISMEDQYMSVHSYMVKTTTGSAYMGTDRTKALDVYCQAVVQSPRVEYIELDRDGKMIKLDHGRAAIRA